MPLATVYSRARVGVEAPLVTVEVHLANGLPGMSIVGLPEAAVREARDRVKSALQNCGFRIPPRRITINLAPADLPKEGGSFDLPIALGVLAASGHIPHESLHDLECLGELALSGELRSVRGSLPAAIACHAQGRRLLVPVASAAEANLALNATVHGAQHLLEVCSHLRGEQTLAPYSQALPKGTRPVPDLADVRGQPRARRALEIAAAGAHNILMVGPPGSGKTMLANRLAGILPPMSEAESLEAATVASVSRAGFDPKDWGVRPFRGPHHSASGAALVGGGGDPRPGEVSLAHRGVLFLDELPEFDRRVLEVLREPLESGRIVISRAANQAEFPAAFQLAAAMNACPCGYLGEDRCQCTQDQVNRYRARLSGPLLDRIDLHIEVPRPPKEALRPGPAEESSATVARRVFLARQRQRERQDKPNAQLAGAEVEAFCRLHDRDHELLDQAMDRLRLSARAYHRILRVARTVADLDGIEVIETAHLSEAIGYRSLDRNTT